MLPEILSQMPAASNPPISRYTFAMSRAMLRPAILVLGLITAAVHIFLNIRLGHLDIPFTLNALGYLGLTYALLFPPNPLKQYSTLIHYALMGFAAITVVAWLIIGNPNDGLAIFDKVAELLLIAAVWLHLRAS